MVSLYNRTHDLSILHQAFVRVAENRGCRGSDGITIENFRRDLENYLKSLQNDLIEKKYHPFPLMRFPIPKSKQAGRRFLSVPTVRDRVAQTAAYFVTKDLFEAEFENISHAFREGRGVRTAIYAIKELADKGYRFAVDADIRGFFDNIDHDLLFKKLKKIMPDEDMLSLFGKWMKAEIYDGDRIYTLQKGIPQGSVVSPLLANLFLDELDETLIHFGLKLVRYADDFLILCKSSKEADQAVEITDMLLDDLKLNLNPQKTKVVNFDQGFKFLGAVFLMNDIFVPMPQKSKERKSPVLPPPLTLKRYIELKNLTD